MANVAGLGGDYLEIRTMFIKVICKHIYSDALGGNMRFFL